MTGFNIFIQILGWFMFSLLCAIAIVVVGHYMKKLWNNRYDIFYGLTTWQKNVPIYHVNCSNQFTEAFSRMFPSVDHYEWQKMKTPLEWLKSKFRKNKTS